MVQALHFDLYHNIHRAKCHTFPLVAIIPRAPARASRAACAEALIRIEVFHDGIARDRHLGCGEGPMLACGETTGECTSKAGKWEDQPRDITWGTIQTHQQKGVCIYTNSIQGSLQDLGYRQIQALGSPKILTVPESAIQKWHTNNSNR